MQIKAVDREVFPGKKVVECFRCGQEGHFAWSCAEVIKVGKLESLKESSLASREFTKALDPWNITIPIVNF